MGRKIFRNKDMAVKAIIFDMDGLMIDSERLYREAQREIGRFFGKEIKDEVLWRMMGRKPIESLVIFVEEHGIPATPEEVFRMRNEIMRGKMAHDLAAMPGLDHILAALHGRVKLAVATGAQQEFLDLVVDRLGIRDRFDVLQSSDSVSVGKPDPEIYLATCVKLGLEPRECIVLEDSANGVLAGKRAGCLVIAVPSEYTEKQDFSPADSIVRDLFEASRQIESLLAS